MPSPTTIRLPEPCHERWAAMHAAGAGRHCASCQQVVVDFTRMTDGEVVAFLQRHPTVHCGRFRDSQLARPLLAAARPVAGWRRWAGATAALLGVGAVAAPGAWGQAAAHAGPVPAAAPAPTGSPRPATEEPANAASAGTAVAAGTPATSLISGVVYGVHGRPVAGIEVSLWSDSLVTYVTTTTDAQGQFHFAVAPDSVALFTSLTAGRPALRRRYMQQDSVELVPGNPQPYALHLKRRRIPRHTMGKFR